MDLQKEKDSLLQLPHQTIRNQYRIKTTKVKVNTAGMISIRSNQYSVSSNYIGETVNYQICDSKIYIYFNTNLIGMHTLSNKKLNYTEEHYKDVLSKTFIGKSSDDISEMAKLNLERIGEIYD